jgi:hypothetical protein
VLEGVTIIEAGDHVYIKVNAGLILLDITSTISPEQMA